MKSPLLLLLIVVLFCSMVQAGSTPQENAEQLMSIYMKSFNEKNRALMDSVTIEPYTYHKCNTTQTLSHEQIFQMALDSKQTVPPHKITNASENDEKNVMWFKIDWTMAHMLDFDVEAVLDNGTWKMKSQTLECKKSKPAA